MNRSIVFGNLALGEDGIIYIYIYIYIPSDFAWMQGKCSMDVIRRWADRWSVVVLSDNTPNKETDFVQVLSFSISWLEKVQFKNSGNLYNFLHHLRLAITSIVLKRIEV